MTNQEAITKLTNIMHDDHYAWHPSILEAFRMAVDALRGAQGDCISRADAIDAFYKYPNINWTTLDVLAKIKALPSAQPEQRWISVSKRLPKQGQEVICQCRANIIKVLKLDADGDWYQDAKHCYMYGFVIAWMPLPEPWKEGEAE